MKKETRTIVYDDELRIEAYRLEGIVCPFPNHFHEYYVIGVIEGGERHLSCKNHEYNLSKGDIVLFHPGDNHACSPINGSILDYRGVNIPKETMLDLAEEVTGIRKLPGFSKNVILNEDVALCLLPLHEMIMEDSKEFEKEEHLLLLISLLMTQYGQPFEHCVLECREEIERACGFMDENYSKRIYLDQICQCANLSKSTLVRAFIQSKGVTPYSYLENIRIGKAKKLLEQGVLPIEAALQTGFFDQSHFTNYFIRYIGLTPGTYRDIFLTKGNRKG